MAIKARSNGLVRPPPLAVRRDLANRERRIGNLIFIPSITLLTVGLLKGGQPNPWSSVAVLAPLIIGAVGLVLWYFVERYVVRDPTVPFDLLLNRTSTIGFVTTLVHGISALCLFYFWPVYFQAVKGASPVRCVIFSWTERARKADDLSRSAVDFFSVAFVATFLFAGWHADLQAEQIRRRSIRNGRRWFYWSSPGLQAPERHRLE